MDPPIHIKIINLPHRADRRDECINELSQASLEFNNIFFEAKRNSSNGAIGCSLSHAMAISEFLFNTNLQFCMILEDDFKLQNPESFKENINSIIKHSNIWDVFLLGHNQAVPIEATAMTNTFRVINSQTASGYIIKRSFAPELIKTFFESSQLLQDYQDLPEPNKKIAQSFFCCDMLWKKHQITHRFLASIPSHIIQRPSFSDIQNEFVDYKA